MLRRILFLDGSISVASLVGRVSLGLMMCIGHGYSKLNLLMSGNHSVFPDPLGIGTFMSLLGAVTTEFFLSLTLIIGLFTRLSAAALAFTMFVAAFIQHANDAFFPSFVRGLSDMHPVLMTPSKEYASLFLVGFLMIAILGPGKFSVDALFRKR